MANELPVNDWMNNPTDIHPQNPPASMSEPVFSSALYHLASIDPDLGWVLANHGPPPMWGREPGFTTLIQIILEQQVSLASAQSIFQRLRANVVPFSAKGFARLSPNDLMSLGVTRQKASYCVGLAHSINQGELDLNHLSTMPDEQAKSKLVSIRGIGPWTAEIYLLMALGRPDIWPTGDVALASALKALKSLPERPGSDDQIKIAELWRPWRAVAARILWHFYLAT